MLEPTIEHISPQLVLGLRKRALYSAVPEMLMETITYLQQHDTQPIAPPMTVYRKLSQADDCAQEHDLEVVWPIAAKIEESDAMKCYELPGGEMVSTVYKGPYEQIGSTYGQLMQWVQSQGKHVAGPVREAYLNDPHEVGMDNALTKIWIPV